MRPKKHQDKPETPQKKIQKRHDPYKSLKYLGYKMSQLPNPYTREQLVRYAKFQLASLSKRLMKDPIWDLYTEEELLQEYFAYQMNDQKFRETFEGQMGDINGVVDDFASWADREMAKEAKVRERLMGETEEKVSFNPNTDVMGEESE